MEGSKCRTAMGPNLGALVFLLHTLRIPLKDPNARAKQVIRGQGRCDA